MRFVIEIVTHLTGIIMEEVYRFAHFGNGALLNVFPLRAPTGQSTAAFHHHRRPLQNGGAFLRRRRKPNRRLTGPRFGNNACSTSLSVASATPADNIFGSAGLITGVISPSAKSVVPALRFGLPFLHGVA